MKVSWITHCCTNSVKFLYDSQGSPVASLINNNLYSNEGKYIGYFLAEYNIFVSQNGNYLGEIVFDNRLLFNEYSPYRFTNFGATGTPGNVGSYANPGNISAIPLPAGYSNIY